MDPETPMIDSYGRGPYQKWIITPLINTGLFSNIHPNTITLCATCIGLLTIPLALLNQSVAAAIALVLSGFLDTLDGSLARAQNSSSEKGTLLDIISDRIVEVSAILALYLLDPSARGLICLLMLGSALLCITTFLTVGIFTENATEKGFAYSAGLMERFEAIALITIMLLFPATFVWLGLIFILGTLYTATWRTYQFSKIYT